MDANALTAPLALFTAGLVTSVHCSGMCGPLTCAILPQKKSPLMLAAYHAARITSYVLIGGILGAVGKSAAVIFTSSPAQILPWVLITLFVVLGLGLEKRLPVPRQLSALIFKLRLGGHGNVRPAALLGLATPFLPCAPLYLVFGVALFSGSFFAGGKMMACFALGTIPLYWLLQSQYFRLQNKLSPNALQWTRQSLAWVSVVLLTWRAVANSGAGLSQIHCPFCQ
jgi:uncharacterized protein